MAMGL